MPAVGKFLHAGRMFARNIGNDLVNPRRTKLQFTRRLLRSLKKGIAGYPQIPTADVFDLFPDARNMQITMDLRYNYWSLSPTDLYFICCIAKAQGVRRVLEIGTYDGNTALLLARNCPEAQITTIDLPQGKETTFVVGERYHDSPERERITQLYGDSTQFDFSPYYGAMDLVFIDGGHDYGCVQSDSLIAQRLVNSTGIIIWDDYLNWSGVKRAVEELAMPGRHLFHLSGTRLAILLPLVTTPPRVAEVKLLHP